MTLTDQLALYDAYHRDRRNVATHIVGIPVIVLAIMVLLGRPVMGVAPAWFAVAFAARFYLRLDLRWGVLMSALFAGAGWLGIVLAQGSIASWLSTGLGMFVGGWALQFIGHAFEGRKPAFMDDIRGLLIGPIFVVAELAFAVGLCSELRGAISGRREDTLAVDALV